MVWELQRYLYSSKRELREQSDLRSILGFAWKWLHRSNPKTKMRNVNDDIWRV